MPLVRRRSIPALACVVLLSCSGYALAETRQMGSDGGSPADVSAGGERLDEAEADAASGAQRRTQKAKPPAAASPRASTRPAAPRWHSFLPGMFR